MRLMVFGAGGLGSCLGALLLDAGHEVTLVARGAHLEAMKERGLRVVTACGSRVVRPRAVATAADAGPADMVFVTTKTHGLEQAARALLPVAREGATLVSLLNGVDAAARLEAAGVEPDRIVVGVTYLTSFREAPGVVRRRGEHGKVVLGVTDPRASSRLVEVSEALERAGLEAPVAADIAVELWSKMAVMCSLVTGCGLTGSEVGAVRAHCLGRSLLRRAIREVADVARATGVGFTDAEETRVLAVLDAFPAALRPSLMHDLDAGRATEIDALNGAISRLGKHTGVETPLSDATVCAVELVGARGS